MQRKALKQLGKVTQWTNEKVFSSEKTQLSDDFTDFEKDIDLRRIGIERLHATSLPFFHQITKAKPTADPYAPSGSGKEKILHTEALGLVMVDYGGDVGGTFGEGLGKYGRARCKLAIVQEEFGARLSDNYIAGMENALAAVNDYKALRKKLDSRRLALDSAVSRAQNSKKESQSLQNDVELARERFEEIEEETKARMVVIQEQEEQQWLELSDLVEAELEYFTKCKAILEDLRDSWPTGDVSSSIANRPRAKSNASARSIVRPKVNSSRQSTDEEGDVKNRSRSHSNASAGKSSRRMLPSFGLGKKAAEMTSGSKRKITKDKEPDDGARRALNSGSDNEDFRRSSIDLSDTVQTRNRSHSALSVSAASLHRDSFEPQIPPMRRTHTTGNLVNQRYAKALYDYPGDASDELPLRVGQTVSIVKEISADWWIGEYEGQTGMFPSSYVEEYVPTPTTAKPVPRVIPPRPRAATATSRPPVLAPELPDDRYSGGITSDSDHSHGFSDTEQNYTASLTAGGRPPSSYKSPPVVRKAAPPPPPSRRSQSSTNILSYSTSSSSLAPPVPSYSRKTNSSSGGSPFAGSEEDDDDEIFGGRSRSGTDPSRGLSSGLGAVHVGQPRAQATSATCGVCGCEDFTQNVFKPAGTCSTCFHSH